MTSIERIAAGDRAEAVRVAATCAFARLPARVAVELMQAVAAANDGSLPESHEYLRRVCNDNAL